MCEKEKEEKIDRQACDVLPHGIKSYYQCATLYCNIEQLI